MTGPRSRLLYSTATVLLCWLLMQAVHELGHVLGAWITGGQVVAVDLHPLRISQTIVDPNPHPVVVVWSGPLFGVSFPLLVWAVCQFRCSPGRRRHNRCNSSIDRPEPSPLPGGHGPSTPAANHGTQSNHVTASHVTGWLRFFAGFCLVANGAYLGAAFWMPVGDGFDLLRHGVPVWQPVLFGIIGVSLGLSLWHGLGPMFGLVRDAEPVPRALFWGVIAVLGIVVAAGLLGNGLVNREAN